MCIRDSNSIGDGQPGGGLGCTEQHERDVCIPYGYHDTDSDGVGCERSDDHGCDGDLGIVGYRRGHRECFGPDHECGERERDDYGDEWFGEYNGIGDGQPGRGLGRTEQQQRGACFRWGHHDTDSDGIGCERSDDLGCDGDLGIIEHIGRDGIIIWPDHECRERECHNSVSYTHLTLPTICSV